MHNTEIPSVRLHTGVTMPGIGLGTWQMTDFEVESLIPLAVELGYRLIDTAAFYGNEYGVGRGVRAADTPRNELFITSKVNGIDQGYERTLRGFDASLSRLGLDYLDLYLIHWPMPMRGLYVDTWRAFARLQAEGRIRAIGVSNFASEHLDRLRTETGIVPAVNQIQLSPPIPQELWRAYAAEHDIVIQSWSPLGQGGGLLKKAAINRVAARHHKSAAQVVLRWHLDQGVVPIPKSSNKDRLTANLDVFDFQLAPDDFTDIATLAGTAVAMDPHTVEQD